MNHKQTYAALVAAGTSQPTPCQQQQAGEQAREISDVLARIGGDFEKHAQANKARYAELSEKSGELQARLLEVEQKNARRGGGGGGNAEFGPSFGSQVEAAFADNRDMFAKTRSLTLDVKAAITTVGTGGMVGSLPVPTAPAQVSTQLIGMLSPGPLNGLTVLHSARRTGITGGAAAQDAEGAAKAAAEPIFTAVMQNCITVAGFATVSEQALNAAGGLARAVDSHLQKSIRDAADAILVGGTTATGWPFAGFAAMAATLTSGATLVSLADAILSGLTRMRLEGFSPSIAVLPEAGFLGVLLAKSTTGEYIFLEALSAALGGARLALSAAVPAGKALLLDTQYCGFLSSGSTRVSLGYVNDQFTKNMVTIRGETELIPYFSDYQGALLVTPAVA